MYVTACEKSYLLKAYSSKIIRKKKDFHPKSKCEIMSNFKDDDELQYFNILTGV